MTTTLQNSAATLDANSATGACGMTREDSPLLTSQYGGGETPVLSLSFETCMCLFYRQRQKCYEVKILQKRK